MFEIPTPPTKYHKNFVKSGICSYSPSDKNLHKCLIIIPNDMALMKIMEARMKMIRDALPNILIIFLTTCCPTSATIVATKAN